MAGGSPCYGVVVDSVNVKDLLYVPVRSASAAPIDCLKSTVTDSLDVGPAHVLSDAGVLATGANAPPTPACTGWGSE